MTENIIYYSYMNRVTIPVTQMMWMAGNLNLRMQVTITSTRYVPLAMLI